MRTQITDPQLVRDCLGPGIDNSPSRVSSLVSHFDLRVSCCPVGNTAYFFLASCSLLTSHDPPFLIKGGFVRSRGSNHPAPSPKSQVSSCLPHHIATLHDSHRMHYTVPTVTSRNYVPTTWDMALVHQEAQTRSLSWSSSSPLDLIKCKLYCSPLKVLTLCLRL